MLGITCVYTVVEVAGGLLSGSLALLADAGHMLSDVLSLGLALFAAWVACRPPTASKTFGYRRAEVLVALFNGVSLVAIALWIFVEAAERLQKPPPLLGGMMLAVAAAGLVVNVIGAVILWRGGSENLNVTAALRHVLADLLGSVGAMAAAVVILLTGWYLADPLISIAIGLLVLYSSWGVLRDSVNILLEATPAGTDAAALLTRLAAHPGVEQVHDLHVWTISSGFPALTAHVVVRPGVDPSATRRELERLLDVEFAIHHTTLQIDVTGEHDVRGSCTWGACR